MYTSIFPMQNVECVRNFLQTPLVPLRVMGCLMDLHVEFSYKLVDAGAQTVTLTQ